MSSLFFGGRGLLFLGLKFNFTFTGWPLAFEAIATNSCNKRECRGRAGLTVAGNETGFSGKNWATSCISGNLFAPTGMLVCSWSLCPLFS